MEMGMDGAQSSVVWWEMSLPVAQSWGWMGFKVPSNPIPQLCVTVPPLQRAHEPQQDAAG